MKTEPRDEHRWLDQLVGEWTYEADFAIGPNQPRQKSKGTEDVHSLGGLWVIAKGEGEMPSGGIAKTVMTLGFDTYRNTYVGTWVGSMMAYLWTYNGTMDSTGTILTLEAEGPSFFKEGKTAKYRDMILLKGDGVRLLTSFALGDDGKWREFMTTTYNRKLNYN